MFEPHWVIVLESRMQRFEWIAAALFLLWASTAVAEPAPWYRWQSVVTGETVCAQTSPGPGWTRLDAVFVDPKCQRRDRSADNAKTKTTR